jgi:Cytochrome P450
VQGLLSARYDITLRRKRQMYIWILKQLGFGQRHMEARINVEVAELVHQFRLTGGQPFDPRDVLHSCVVNVIHGLIFGYRYPQGHRDLAELRRCLHDVYESIVAEVELFSILRFFPFYRSRHNECLARNKKFLNLLHQKVHDNFNLFVCKWGVGGKHNHKI